MPEGPKRKNYNNTTAGRAAHDRYMRKRYVDMTVHVRTELMDAIDELQNDSQQRGQRWSRRMILEFAVRQYCKLYGTDFDKLIPSEDEQEEVIE